jgi:hypothetical protein
MSQQTAPNSVENRLDALEQISTNAVQGSATAAAAPSPLRKYGPGVTSVLALVISIAAVIVPSVQEHEAMEQQLSAEQRAAIGPVLNDVYTAENKLWDAKMELSSSAEENAALENKIAELQSAYLDATYQVVPHGGLKELTTMNRLTQAVLSSGYSPGEKSENQISQEQVTEHSGRVNDFRKMYSCAVNTSDRKECG